MSSVRNIARIEAGSGRKNRLVMLDSLGGDHEMCPAVLGPGAVVVGGIEREFLP